MEVFVLFHFFNYDHLTVGRRYNNAFRVMAENADGATEEVDEDSICDNGESQQNIERHCQSEYEVGYGTEAG